MTASVLLVGVESANSAQRRARRSAFVDHRLANFPVLEFSVAVARTHARMLAAVSKSKTAGGHDALIAATAILHGRALLTRNVAAFRIFPGLRLEAFVEPAQEPGAIHVWRDSLATDCGRSSLSGFKRSRCPG